MAFPYDKTIKTENGKSYWVRYFNDYIQVKQDGYFGKTVAIVNSTEEAREVIIKDSKSKIAREY